MLQPIYDINKNIGDKYLKPINTIQISRSILKSPQDKS